MQMYMQAFCLFDLNLVQVTSLGHARSAIEVQSPMLSLPVAVLLAVTEALCARMDK